MNKSRYKINQNTVELDIKLTAEDKKVVHLSANYPNASSVTWDFGDGMSKNLSKRAMYMASRVFMKSRSRCKMLVASAS